MSSNSRWWRGLILWGPVAVMLAVFLVESQQFMGVGATYIQARHYYEDIFGTITMKQWMILYGVLRKLGHMAGYGFFSALVFRALYLQRRAAVNSLWKLHGYALLATAVIGSMDELHQCFLPGRDGCFDDVAIDTAGAVFAQLILSLILWNHQLRNEQQKEA
jgi:VanZ family protein